MSDLQHLTITVTSSDNPKLETTRSTAKALFGDNRVSELIKGEVGLYSSFMVSPSGSNEGYEECKLHKQRMFEFIALIDSMAESIEDKNDNILKYVVFSFGDYGAMIHATNQTDQVVKRKYNYKERFYD